MRWQENVEQTLTGKKIASVASLSQLVQHEKKKSEPTRSQKDRECLINTKGQLQKRVTDAANQIRKNSEMLNSVYENWYRRTQMCINANGRHKNIYYRRIFLVEFTFHWLVDIFS
jgi:membrane-bound lytic murein transglycosylase